MLKSLVVATAALLAFVSSPASAAPISFTWEFLGTATVGGTNYAGGTIVGSGDTDDLLLIDATRRAIEVNASLQLNGLTTTFTEPVYFGRAGGTMGFFADLAPPLISSVFSANGVSPTYDLVSDLDILLDPGLFFGGYNTAAGEVTNVTYAADTSVRFTATVGTVTPVSEPLGLSLLLGGLGLLGSRRKTRK